MTDRRNSLVAFAIVAQTLFGIPLRADNERLSWPARGGPFRTGVAFLMDARGVPMTWNEQSGENIAWKIPLEGEGHSTPVIGRGWIWMTAANPEGTRQYVYCIDEQTGQVLHHRLLFENANPEPLGNGLNTYASPSCVLEKDAVYVHYGSYGTARLNPETAEIVWQRRDIECRHYRGPGSSPEVFEDLLILTFDGIDQQFLTALDKATGQTVWRTDRSTDYGDLNADGKPRGDGDYRKAFSTPLVVDVQGRAQVISTGSRAAFGYDARTGEELWTITHDDFNASARPLPYNGHAIINTGTRGANLKSVRLDETTRGNVDETHVVWDRTRGNSDLSNPLLLDGRIYMVTDAGVATCVDAGSGEELWIARVGGTFVSSPVSDGKFVYFCDQEGVTTIVRAGGTYEMVAKNELAEGLRSSPAIANGAIYLRTSHHLYKIAESPAAR